MKTELATEIQFEPIKVIGVNEKSAQDFLRDTERLDHSLQLSYVALDLSSQPTADWIRLFQRVWSVRLKQEVAARGGFDLPKTTDVEHRRINIEDQHALTRRIFDGRQAGVPGISNDRTIFWSLEVMQPFGGLAAYIARVLAMISETNAAYPRDTRVIAQREEAAKKAVQKEARRAEAEKILATVKAALGG